MTPEELFEAIKHISLKELYYRAMSEEIDYIIVPEERLQSCAHTSNGLIAAIQHNKDSIQSQNIMDIKNLHAEIISHRDVLLNKNIPRNNIYSYQISFGNFAFLVNVETSHGTGVDH